ncbi:hypothetical protein [Paenibacillus sp. Marseille-Q4541]|uniref:hypothetical protein n=1 Tax=Paenibacillus sp. Marseille-Q4541 TaxID=2831522 RepID=UPI001BAB8083|nr:hypothetical protein [Paenibacillus sp. Marseille-Q4541]
MLIDIADTSVNKKHLDILIRLDYFDMFGNSGYLLKLYDEFQNGEFKYKKTYVDQTKAKRLEELRKMEIELSKDNDLKLLPNEIIMFQKELLGYCELTYPNMDLSWCVVTEIDTKYSPKLTLYNLNKGAEKVFKMSKKLFNTRNKETQIVVGDLIQLLGHKNEFKKVPDGNGNFVATDQKEQWITEYKKYIIKENENE